MVSVQSDEHEGEGLHDEGSEEPEVDAEGWSDLMEGKIRRRTLTQGSGPYPEMNQDVVCSFEVRLESDPLGKALQRRPKMRYRIGEGEAVPMLELSLRHMAEGSVCEVTGSSTWAWGPVGLPAAGEGERNIPPDADVRMLVTLHQCLPMADNREVSWDEKVETVTWRKSNGNDHFRRRDFQKAKKCYTQACEVFGGDYEAPGEEDDADAAGLAAKGLVADCAANLAAVYLETGDIPKAKEAAEGALMMAPSHVKSMYRLARACLLLDEFQECNDAIDRALALEPDNAGVKKVQAELRKKRFQYSSKSKKLAEAVVGNLKGEYDEAPTASAVPSDAELIVDTQTSTGEGVKRGVLRSAIECVEENRVWIVGAIVLVVVCAIMFVMLPREQAQQALAFSIMAGGSAMSVKVILRGDDDIKRKQL